MQQTTSSKRSGLGANWRRNSGLISARVFGTSARTNCELGEQLLVFEVTPNSEVSIRTTDRPRRLTVELDPERLRVGYACGAGTGEYFFHVNPDATLSFETPYHLRYSPDEMALKLLDLLLKSDF